jgi:hypothetical protein
LVHIWLLHCKKTGLMWIGLAPPFHLNVDKCGLIWSNVVSKVDRLWSRIDLVWSSSDLFFCVSKRDRSQSSRWRHALCQPTSQWHYTDGTTTSLVHWVHIFETTLVVTSSAMWSHVVWSFSYCLRRPYCSIKSSRCFPWPSLLKTYCHKICIIAFISTHPVSHQPRTFQFNAFIMKTIEHLIDI